MVFKQISLGLGIEIGGIWSRIGHHLSLVEFDTWQVWGGVGIFGV